jgi:hypothetical protein
MVRSIPRIYLLAGTLTVGVLVAFFFAVLSSGAKSQAQETTGDPVLAAAGDIADCTTQNDEATAALLATMPGATGAPLGDNAYPDGSAQDYLNCYAPSWGLYKDQTRPAVGNHEYNTAGASGYFDYFGATAGERGKGYYSYELGSWHIVVLNSNCTSGSRPTWPPTPVRARSPTGTTPASPRAKPARPWHPSGRLCIRRKPRWC